MEKIKKELKEIYPNCRIKLEVVMKSNETTMYNYVINSRQGYQVAIGSVIVKNNAIAIYHH